MTSANWNAPREQGSWNVPGAAPAYPPPGEAPAAARRGRPGLIALVVALTELVVVAAVGNQSVSKHLLNYGVDHLRSFPGSTAVSLTQFSWRVTPRNGDNRGGYHQYYSQWTAIAVLVVVSVLLSLIVVRGDVTFSRAWLGVWTAVVAAAFLGRIIGSLVTARVNPMSSRATNAVYLSAGSDTFVYGVLLGLLTGLVAAFVAVGTRRGAPGPSYAAAAPNEPAYVPEAPPPFYGSSAPDTRPRDPRAEHETTALPNLSKGGGAHSTQELPEAPEQGENRTMQIPRFDPRGGQHWTPPQSDGESTQAMPNTPGDEGRR